MDLDNRKYARFRAQSGLTVSLQAEDSGLKTEGVVLNISQGGAYLLAPSIPFETADVRFTLPDANPLVKRCRRVDPHHQGAKGMAVEFSDLLALEELELLMDADSPC